MNMVCRDVPAAMAAGIASAIGAIPGCALRSISLRKSNANNTIEVVHVGWSPSLHDVWVTHVLTPNKPLAEMSTQDMLKGLESRLKTQTRRSVEGLAMDRPFPMPHDTDDGVEIGHLYIDASSLAMLMCEGATQGRTVKQSLYLGVSEPLHWLHHNDTGYRGGPNLGNDHVMVADELGTQVVKLETVLKPVHRGSDMSVTLKGRVITVTDMVLPETIVVASAGRRLGDLVELHPLLDGRVIEEIRTDDGWTEIVLTDALFRIGDLDGEAAACRLMALTGCRNDMNTLYELMPSVQTPTI